MSVSFRSSLMPLRLQREYQVNAAKIHAFILSWTFRFTYEREPTRKRKKEGENKEIMIANNPLEIEFAKLKEVIDDLKDELGKFKELKREWEKYRKLFEDFIKKGVLNEHGK